MGDLQLRINREDKFTLCQETEITWFRVNLAEDGQGSDVTDMWRIPSHRKEESRDVKHVKQSMDLYTL